MTTPETRTTTRGLLPPTSTITPPEAADDVGAADRAQVRATTARAKPAASPGTDAGC